MHVTSKVRQKRICYVKPVRKIFSSWSYEIPKLNGANIFFVEDALAVTAVELESDIRGTRTWK